MNILAMLFGLLTSDKGKSIIAVLGTIGTAVLGHYSYSKQTELEALGLKKAQLVSELAILETNLGSAKARLADLQKEKELSDSMYLELKSKYSAIADKLAVSKQTIKQLRSIKGGPDDIILETKLTANIATVANGGVLPTPK